MCMRFLCVAAMMLVMSAVGRAGTYCGAVGTTGCTAISMEDASFVEWASGYQNYVVGANCASSWQTPEKALGKAVGSSFDIVCLGDAGQLTLTFDKAITNGSGYDFAVFENSFNDTFLELAYVEASSDGINFFRFANDSQTTSSVGGFGAVDPTNIDGLAGKYIQGYGTPFDLSSLAGVSSLLDVNAVEYVRIVDIVGDGTCKDTSGDVIYDPYPCSGSAGFDLDAVGVIHTIPEPSSIVLLVIAVLGIAVAYRRGLLKRLVERREQPVSASEPPAHCPRKSTSIRSPYRMIPLASFVRHDSSIWHTTAAFTLVFIALAGTSRGDVVTFEDLGQGPSAFTIGDATYGYYWNGSDGSGGFTSGNAFFNNNNSDGAWSGCSYSNVNYTDTSVSDYTHQFAAVTGAGVGGSGNYALGYGCSSCIDLFGGVLPEVTIPDGMKVVSAMFTNTTYAAASMLHGDSFAKQFSSSDWFKLIITGEDASGASIGSVDFYLAQNGSMVTTWESVDLSSLAAAKTLEFDLTSSDTGSYGMNTPAYFAMDNLTLAAVPEPSMLSLLGMAGIVGAIWIRKRHLALRTAALGRKECC